MTGTDMWPLTWSMPTQKWVKALFFTLRSAVNPLTGRVADRVHRNSPARVRPQWATVSASMSPGSVIGPSKLVRSGIAERRRCGAGLVPHSPEAVGSGLVWLQILIDRRR